MQGGGSRRTSGRYAQARADNSDLDQRSNVRWRRRINRWAAVRVICEIQRVYRDEASDPWAVLSRPQVDQSKVQVQFLACEEACVESTARSCDEIAPRVVVVGVGHCTAPVSKDG